MLGKFFQYRYAFKVLDCRLLNTMLQLTSFLYFVSSILMYCYERNIFKKTHWEQRLLRHIILWKSCQLFSSVPNFFCAKVEARVMNYNQKVIWKTPCNYTICKIQINVTYTVCVYCMSLSYYPVVYNIVTYVFTNRKSRKMIGQFLSSKILSTLNIL